jgi:hypothetical protein
MPDGRRRSEHEENRPHHQRRKRPGNSLKTKRVIRMTGKAENPATIKPRQKNDGVCQRSEARFGGAFSCADHGRSRPLSGLLAISEHLVGFREPGVYSVYP